MQEQLEVAIRNWQDADKLAEENPKLLQNWTPENSETATERMENLFAAEKELVQVISSMNGGEIPVSISDWLLTYPMRGARSGCADCWLSSMDDERKHPDCVKLIKQHFDAVAAMRSL